MTTRSLNTTRYLTFEISTTCDMAHLHSRCPIGHPERYLYGNRTYTLSDNMIFDFWAWARYSRNFRGIIMWHSYNEPTLSITRIRTLMERIKRHDAHQPFLLITNVPPGDPKADGFDMVKHSDYDPDDPGFSRAVNGELDHRIDNRTGKGKPYSAMQPRGWCGRAWGWELLIDHHGGWNLCCADWRNEEAIGNIHTDDWPELLARYEDKARNIRWKDEASYNALPRLCRACLDVTPNLHRSGAAF